MTPKEFAIRILKEVPSVTTISFDESGTVPVITVWFSEVFKISIKGPNTFEGTPEEYRYSYILSEMHTNIAANWSDADGILRIMKECETPATPENQPERMTTIHKILKSLAERARNLSVDTVYQEGYRKGYHHALDEVAVEIDKAVVSVHDPIAGAIGSVAYDRMRIITEAGFLVAHVHVFDLVQSVEGIFQDDFGQWIADAINEKIGGTCTADE